MNQVSGSAKEDRIPPASEGISINCCVKPWCKNYLVPAVNSRNDPHYIITGGKQNGQSIKCRACESHYTIKSNIAITEELSRLRYDAVKANMFRQDGTCCYNQFCTNFGLSTVEFPLNYRKCGRTSQSNQRFQCKNCETRFTAGSQKRKSHPDSKSYLNDMLYRFLVNKGVPARATEFMDLSYPTVLRKINMFYERSVAFVQKREARLPNIKLGRMRLAVDRQEYNVNWTARRDKRNIVVSAIGSADIRSGYVFGMEINYDSQTQLNQIETAPEYDTEKLLKPFNRKFARIWTPEDYGGALESSAEFAKVSEKIIAQCQERSLPIPLTQAAIASMMDNYSTLNWFSANEQYQSRRLPNNGTQVHSEYTLFAHFLRLKELIGHAWQLRFYLDQEGGIDRALNMAFGDRIAQGDCHAAYVRINKELTVDERRTLVVLSQSALYEIVQEQGVSETEAKKMILQENLVQPMKFKNRSEEWYSVPLHRIHECEKYLAFVTDRTRLEEDDLFSIMMDASLHRIDSFFNQVRRRVTALERPIHSQSNAGRVWTGYSPYDPMNVERLVQIFRTYYNYVLPGEDGNTPAMRLGLARGPVEIRRILYP